MREIFNLYNRWISMRGYLANRMISMADVLHIPLIRALNEYPDAVPLKGFDAVQKWWTTMANFSVQTKIGR